VLLEVATAYLDLLGAEGRLAILRQSELDFGEVARLTSEFARTGQGRPADADRARTDLLLLHTQEQAAEEAVAVAAARLARLLNTDPAERLRIANGPVQVVGLVDPSLCLEQLIQMALRNRPEMGAGNAAIAAAGFRLRQEKVRPFVPLLAVGYSAGEFGGGSDLVHPEFGRFGGRADFDVLAVWTLQGAGLGNLARIKGRRAEMDAAESELVVTINRIRREVAAAAALSAARLRDVEVNQRRVETALQGFRLDLTRIRGAQGLPIEVLDSARLLVDARQAFLAAIIGYDQAQFQLFVALGQPPELALPNAGGCPAPEPAAVPAAPASLPGPEDAPPARPTSAATTAEQQDAPQS
jgi:outer membrane protein TolC